MKEKTYPVFLFEYYHDDSWWSIEIPALSEADARERLNKMPLAKYLGTLEMKIPARLGLFARLVVWWQNRKPLGVER